MQTLKLRFVLTLERWSIPHMVRPNGALFNRFLPNGPEDAIRLTEDSDPWDIQVWFRRQTKLRHGFLHYDVEGSEFDEGIMRRQGKLEAGPLRGEIIVPDVTEPEFAALLINPKRPKETFGQDSGNDPVYIGLAKRIIEKLQPRISTFISTLRHQYGQYWLKELGPWDADTCTLGSYCNSYLHLCWWSEARSDWFWFLPTDSGATMIMQPLPGRGYEEYLTERDWRHLQETRCLGDVSAVVQLIGHAAESLDNEDSRQAFVEASTALELAIDARLTATSKDIRSALKSFDDRAPHKARVAVVLVLLGMNEIDIEIVLQTVHIRNKVVHEGYSPTSQDCALLRRAMVAVRLVAGVTEIKVPVLESGNSLSPDPGAKPPADDPP